MLRKLQVVAMLLCMFSYAVAGTVSIGSASARGDMRVDNYTVKGNATLFDGSVVETGQATADLRLGKGTEITMSTSSRGTLYRDRLVLQQGASELASNSSFNLEANGLHVTPIEPNSRGVVSIRSGNTVEVAALNGSFGVTNDHGVLLASVHPGHVLSFAMKASASPDTTETTVTGMISSENGHYYVTDSNDQKFEIVGKNFKSFVGTKSIVTGNIPTTTQAAGAVQVVLVKSIAINGLVGMSASTAWIVTGVVAGAGAGIGVGVYETTKPASR